MAESEEIPFDVDLFNNQVANSTKYFWKTVGGLVSDRPFPENDLVYHYTTVDSAINIISSQAIWSSNIAFLNDSAELQCARNIFDHLPKYMTEIVENPILNSHYTRIQSLIKGGPNYSTFVTSFCERGDLLGQWRGYGNGVSIAFSAPELDSEFPETKLNRVLYDPNVQVATFAALLKSVSDWIQEDAESRAKLIGMVAFFAKEAFDRFSAKMKNAAFTEEREWRLTTIRPTTLPLDQAPSVEFRTRGRGVVPYIVLKPRSGRLPIRGICLSPNAHMSLGPTLSALLLKHGYTNPTVMPSSIPFRD